ncbi:MAG: hypothetical protein GY851_09345 [bacterium]|nr:hypothetical protein [bacterium]
MKRFDLVDTAMCGQPWREMVESRDGEWVRYDDRAKCKGCEAVRDAVEDALGHVGAARMQTIETDDQIIAGHIRDAEVLLGNAFRAINRIGSQTGGGE